MRISREDVEAVARLAHLRLSEDEVRDMGEDLGAILDYIGRLDELDIDDLPPLFNPVASGDNVWREDQVRDAGVTEAFLRGVPETVDGYPRVPRVVDTSGEGER
ncbi:MAG: Asp-tRNA(Asn)/Glu-tRNA(Gln) amidotransferase subunit GatC [Bacillota bacterium]